MNDLVRKLITQGLGYCCVWAFFHHFKHTALIADRLGVSDRAVRKMKQAVRSGCETCREAKNCQLKLGALKKKRPLR